VVAPRPLIDRLARERFLIDRQGGHALELAIAELIEDDELGRHTRKMRRIYHARRDALVSALHGQLRDRLTFLIPTGGIALWAETSGLDVDRWCQRARDRGVIFQPGSASNCSRVDGFPRAGGRSHNGWRSAAGGSAAEHRRAHVVDPPQRRDLQPRGGAGIPSGCIVTERSSPGLLKHSRPGAASATARIHRRAVGIVGLERDLERAEVPAMLGLDRHEVARCGLDHRVEDAAQIVAAELDGVADGSRRRGAPPHAARAASIQGRMTRERLRRPPCSGESR